MSALTRHRTAWLVGACLVALGLSLVLFDSRVRLFAILPYLVLLACPLMHFGHTGHRKRSARQTSADGAPSAEMPGTTQAGGHS